ncbi:MAG: cell division protein ZapB [Treponema sp.]|nr:cell division protein ZapB [Treponema sp.]
MISIEQVLLLEEKVESAVKKIEQLNAENAALRSKCAELSNALNAKSEQFSSFQSDQSKIEEGILKALSRLNAVENVVFQASAGAQPLPQASHPTESVQNSEETPVVSEEEEPAQNEVLVSDEPVDSAATDSEIEIQVEPSLDSQEPVAQQSEESELPKNQESPFSESLTPDIDFEFGESDVSAQSENATVENPEQNQDSAPDSQPLFDIF